MTLGGYDYLKENWLYILVMIHVLSAIIGIGPTYFSHILLRKGQTYGKLRHSMEIMPTLEKFPKILGSIAVISGILLALAWRLWIQATLDLWIYCHIHHHSDCRYRIHGASS